MQTSGLPGDFTVWGDVLWEGPHLPHQARADEILARAQYFAGPLGDPSPLVAMQEGWDLGLARASQHDEVVIWLEHDLHDQAQLIRHLDWFSRHPHPNLSLICLGAFPGIEPFFGLGQLHGPQLASLFPDRQPVTPAQLALGRRAWAALTETTPTAWADLLTQDTSLLPFLKGAVVRLLEEYPAPATGLGRTETTILTELRHGPASPADLFRRSQQQEERAFMGDSSFARLLDGLSHGAEPLLSIPDAAANPATPLSSAPATLTAAGRDTLARQRDRVQTLGIDRWLGGVHLHGKSVRWRWDRTEGRLSH